VIGSENFGERVTVLNVRGPMERHRCVPPGFKTERAVKFQTLGRGKVGE